MRIIKISDINKYQDPCREIHLWQGSWHAEIVHKGPSIHHRADIKGKKINSAMRRVSIKGINKSMVKGEVEWQLWVSGRRVRFPCFPRTPLRICSPHSFNSQHLIGVWEESQSVTISKLRTYKREEKNANGSLFTKTFQYANKNTKNL